MFGQQTGLKPIVMGTLKNIDLPQVCTTTMHNLVLTNTGIDLILSFFHILAEGSNKKKKLLDLE